MAWARQGATTCARWATNGGRRATKVGAARHVGAWRVAPDSGLASIMHRSTSARRMDPRSPLCFGVCVQRRTAGTDVERRATSSACARSPTETIPFSLVWPEFSPKCWTEVHQGLNRKVVDLASLYNFYKGCMAFFSTNRAQIACQVGGFLGADE
jgi:hypothetical protein